MTKNDEKSYIGLDISKNFIDVYILPSNKYMQFNNNDKNIKKLVKKIKMLPKQLVVMEATGGYEKAVAESIAKEELAVCVVNPRQIRNFAKAMGKLAKTDKVDAMIIATYAQKISPKPNVSCDKEQQKLQEVSRRRQQLVDLITMESNRLEKADKIMQTSIKRTIKFLEKELAAINKMQSDIIKNNQKYNKKSKLLQSIKGVGEQVSTVLIANLPELGQLSHREISALVGVAPLNCDSGQYKGKRATWGGRSYIRSKLYMAALVAVRFNQRLKHFYQSLCERGKSKKLALVAVMRKLLITMNAMMRNNEEWREDYEQNNLIHKSTTCSVAAC